MKFPTTVLLKGIDCQGGEIVTSARAKNEIHLKKLIEEGYITSEDYFNPPKAKATRGKSKSKVEDAVVVEDGAKVDSEEKSAS